MKKSIVYDKKKKLTKVANIKVEEVTISSSEFFYHYLMMRRTHH